MSTTQYVSTLAPLPPRSTEGHKGLFGRVLIVGGSEEMIGAPVLAGTAALKAGAGLVQIAVPRSILPHAISITPELIGLGLGRAAVTSQLRGACESADAIVVGPGLGRTPTAAARLKQLIRLDGKPMVIDADGLNLLAAAKRWPRDFKAHAVLTPHPGEMKRLGKLLGVTEVPTDDQGRTRLAASAASVFGQVLVLKGNRTVVADAGGSRIYINHSGNSALSKAGTGDVLSGILGAFLAQNMNRFDAACAAVHIHGIAGEIAGEKLGLRSVLSRDVIDSLPEAIRRYEHP